MWTPASQAQPSLPSEGSVIAYYWSEFDIPKHLVKEAEQAMAEKRMVTVPPRARSMSSFVMTSVVAFRECRGHRGGRLSGLEQGLLLGWCGGLSSPGLSAWERSL